MEPEEQVLFGHKKAVIPNVSRDVIYLVLILARERASSHIWRRHVSHLCSCAGCKMGIEFKFRLGGEKNGRTCFFGLFMPTKGRVSSIDSYSAQYIASEMQEYDPSHVLGDTACHEEKMSSLRGPTSSTAAAWWQGMEMAMTSCVPQGRDGLLSHISQ